jgi:hypothetical protein
MCSTIYVCCNAQLGKMAVLRAAQRSNAGRQGGAAVRRNVRQRRRCSVGIFEGAAELGVTTVSKMFSNIGQNRDPTLVHYSTFSAECQLPRGEDSVCP